MIFPGPAIDVVAYSTVARMRSIRRLRSADRHDQGLVHCLGYLVGVERVDQARLRQFSRGTREVAEDQYTIAIEPAGDKLLGNQIHAIVQRADDAEIGQQVQRDQRRSDRHAFE